MRASVSWKSGWSRIAQLSAREGDEDIVEGGVVRGEQRQLGALAFQQPQQRRYGAVDLRYRQRDAIGPGADPLHSGKGFEPGRRRPAAEREFDDLIGPERRDQLR